MYLVWPARRGMAPLGGIEPHTIHPTLRIGLEDRCRAQGLFLLKHLFSYISGK